LGTLDIEKLQQDVANIILEYGHLSLSELRLSVLLPQLWQLMTSHGLSLQPHLVWLLKAVATGEDIAHRLDADFNLVEYSTPYVWQLLKRSMSPRRQARDLEFAAIDLLNLLKELPYEVRGILHQVRAGRFKIEFEHIGLRPLRQTLIQATNRLAIAVVLASLLIGSSLILLSRLPPLVFGLPVIGLIGYVISGLLGIWLTISILWSRGK
jgi:ubiquinone biosynthesis protein